jgi:hypothetical protein
MQAHKGHKVLQAAQDHKGLLDHKVRKVQLVILVHKDHKGHVGQAVR